MKIDTEGYEMELLKGFTEILKKLKYVILDLRLSDVDTYKPIEIIKLMENFGYQWSKVLDYGDSLGFLTYIDVLFTKEQTK